jgi:DNA-binding transcriptional MerR regulator
MEDTPMELLTTKRVAQMAGLTPDAVRYHERLGHLIAIKVDRGGGNFQRLFLREDIERFLRQRTEKREPTAEAAQEVQPGVEVGV